MGQCARDPRHAARERPDLVLAEAARPFTFVRIGMRSNLPDGANGLLMNLSDFGERQNVIVAGHFGGAAGLLVHPLGRARIAADLHVLP